MIQIKNLRNERPTKPWDVRVDRSSPFGNPYFVGGRQHVCSAYANRFERITRQAKKGQALSIKEGELVRELHRLRALYIKYGKLNLFCWCAPKRCHAETIRDYLKK